MEDMIKLREPKEDDQEQTNKAFNLIKNAVESNPEIEGSIWVSMCSSLIASSFKDNGHSYEDYCTEMTLAMKHYKSWFDENN